MKHIVILLTLVMISTFGNIEAMRAEIAEDLEYLEEKASREDWSKKRLEHERLSLVIEGQDTAEVEELLKNNSGVCMNYRPEKSSLSLLELACRHPSEEIIKLLLDKGSEIEGPDGDGQPLDLAAFHGNSRTVNALLMRRATMVRPLDEPTPLHMAARSGRVGIARTLLKHGVNPNAWGTVFAPYKRKYYRHKLILPRGYSVDALDLAQEFGHKGIIAILSRVTRR